MKRLVDAFAGKGKRLIAYLTVGDPGQSGAPIDSVALAHACIEAGADVLELGVPFSDPFADGPIIAAASHRALTAGGGLDETLRVARELRASTDVPMVLFGYANPLWIRGFRESAEAAAEAGIDAFLVVDLPLPSASIEGQAQEHDLGLQLRQEAQRVGLGVVPLLAPTSDAARIARASELRDSSPFVYYVSVAGVTGAAAVPVTEAAARAQLLERELSLPVAIGFGIDSPEKAHLAAYGPSGAGGAKGVVVGSALVSAIAAASNDAERCAAAASVLDPLRTALNSP